VTQDGTVVVGMLPDLNEYVPLPHRGAHDRRVWSHAEASLHAPTALAE
jgi:hypothetical protein